MPCYIVLTFKAHFPQTVKIFARGKLYLMEKNLKLTIVFAWWTWKWTYLTFTGYVQIKYDWMCQTLLNEKQRLWLADAKLVQIFALPSWPLWEETSVFTWFHVFWSMQSWFPLWMQNWFILWSIWFIQSPWIWINE